MVGFAAGILVLASIVAGFFIMGTPGQVRLYRYDSQKVSDLQSLQWQIVNYYQQKQKLPADLADLEDPISGSMVPLDPQSGESYVFATTGKLSFKLCAVFNAESQGPSQGTYYPERAIMAPSPVGGKGVEDNWQHSVGEQCFERTIDPERYPPFEKPIR